MWTGSPKRGQVIQRNNSALKPLGRRRTRRVCLLAGFCLLVLAVMPVAAQAAPSVVSESASQITASNATLEATIGTQPAEDVITQFQLATSPGELPPEFRCPRIDPRSVCIPDLPGETPFPNQDVSPPGGSVSLSLAGIVTLRPSTTYYYRILAAKTIVGGDVLVVEPPIVYGAIQSFTTPAPQHWYRSGARAPEGESVPIVTFGEETNLTQNGGLGEVSCRATGGGVVENPVGGGPGVGRTNSLGFYECKAPQCEEKVKLETGLEGRGTATTENNPAATKEPASPGWTNVLEESTVAGTSSVMEKIGEPFVTFKTPSPPGMIRSTLDCTIAANQQIVAEGIFEGELKPEIGMAKSANLNGTSASKPSKVKFSAPNKPVETIGEQWWSGVLKYLGYNEQEVITVKP